jgi:hypothetical protein
MDGLISMEVTEEFIIDALNFYIESQTYRVSERRASDMRFTVAYIVPTLGAGDEDKWKFTLIPEEK